MPAPQRALVVIDAQQEYFEGLLQIGYPPREESLARTLDALRAAENAGIPVVIVQHESPEGAPVFAKGSGTGQLHPEIAVHAETASKHVVKNYGSVFAATDLETWLRGEGIDTITLTGYMTNNCVLASAAAAEPLGFAVEVLSDATGAINITNEAGSASARQVHETLMALLNSNWAAVSTTTVWAGAVERGDALTPSNLIVSAAAEVQTTR